MSEGHFHFDLGVAWRPPVLPAVEEELRRRTRVVVAARLLTDAGHRDQVYVIVDDPLPLGPEVRVGQHDERLLGWAVASRLDDRRRTAKWCKGCGAVPIPVEELGTADPVMHVIEHDAECSAGER